MKRKNYIMLAVAIAVFFLLELWVDYLMVGSSLEIKLLLAVTLILIFNVIAKQLKQSEKS